MNDPKNARTPPPADIDDDDPELQAILRRLPKLQYPVLEFFKLASIGVTLGYAQIASGWLRTYTIGTKRLVDARDGAKWMLARKRAAAARSSVSRDKGRFTGSATEPAPPA